MQTRSFFQFISTINFFRRKDQIAEKERPQFQPEVKQKKTSAGNPRRSYFRKPRLVFDSPSTNPKFMSRVARIRAGLQPARLTWYQARRKREQI